MQIDHGGFELGMAWNAACAEVDTGQMGGIGMPEGMGSDVSFADTGALFGLAKSALDAAAGMGEWRWPGGFHRVRMAGKSQVGWRWVFQEVRNRSRVPSGRGM